MKETDSIVKDLTDRVLKIADEMCVNTFSDNILYIKIMSTELSGCNNFFEENRLKFKMLMQKKLLTFEEIVQQIKFDYDKMLWIDFLLYYTCKKFNVILVTLIPKENINSFMEVKFHCCISTPPFLKEEGKFDINWQFKSLPARWKIFWWRKCL